MNLEEAIKYIKDFLEGRLHSSYTGDAIIPALEYAVKVLESAKKYRRHDLRKNPEDLPAVEERVVLTLDLLDLVGEYRNVYGYRAKNGAWVVNGFETRLDVIAWRTDELFEEDDK